MIIHHRRLLRFPVRGLIGAFNDSAFFSTGQDRDPCSRRTTMRTKANCQINPASSDKISARGRAVGPEKVRAANNGATTQASIAMGSAAAAHTFITVLRVHVGIWTVRTGVSYVVMSGSSGSRDSGLESLARHNRDGSISAGGLEHGRHFAVGGLIDP
jgi:hypothetical protein